MPWELPAIWIIVIATLALFVLDERRIRQRAEREKLEKAAEFYARAPQYRFVSVEEPPPAPPVRPGSRYAHALVVLNQMRSTTQPASGQ